MSFDKPDEPIKTKAQHKKEAEAAIKGGLTKPRPSGPKRQAGKRLATAGRVAPERAVSSAQLAKEEAARQAARTPTGRAKPYRVDPLWKVAERDAKGRVSVYVDKDDIRHYTPNSAMWNMGYRTSEEYRGYREAILDKSGKQIGTKSVGGGAVGHGKVGPKSKAPWVAVKDYRGQPVHISKKDYKKVIAAGGEPRAQFNLLKKLKLIPKTATLYLHESGNWGYRLPGKTKRVRYIEGQGPSFKGTIVRPDLAVPKAILHHEERQRQLKKRGPDKWPEPIPKPEPHSWVELGVGIKKSLPDVLKAIYDNSIGRKPDKKSTLIYEYYDYKKQPSWAKLLFGPQVIKDKSTGKYHRVILTEPPVIGPAGSPVKVIKAAKILKQLKVIGPGEVGMSESQFARFIRLRVLNPRLTPEEYKANDLLNLRRVPNIDWNKLKIAIQNGGVRNAKEAATWAKANTLKRIKVPKIDDVREAMRVTIREPAQQQFWRLSEGKWVPTKAYQAWLNQYQPKRFLTKADMDRLITEWLNMKPTEALRQWVGSGLVGYGLTTSPLLASRLVNGIVQSVSPEELRKSLTDVSPATKTAMLTYTEAMAKAEASPLAKTKGETKTETSTKTETKTETKAQAQAKGATETKPQTKPKTAPAAATKIGRVAPPSVLKAPPRIPPRIPPVKAPPIVPPVPPKILPRQMSEKQKREYIEKAGGAVGLRMGELNGKDVWHIKVEPYTGVQFILVGKKPEGAKLVEGPGSGYKSAFHHKKLPKQPVYIKVGNQRVSLTPAGGSIRAAFTRGITVLTAPTPRFDRGLFRVTGKPMRITPKSPRITR